MSGLSVREAEDMVEALKWKELSRGRPENRWYTYGNHVFGAAEAARIIASRIEGMDSERAYICGLLHDIAKLEEGYENPRFHGILGYELLAGKDAEAARACLLHMFPWNRIPPFAECSGKFFGNRKDYDFVVDFVAGTSVRDEDLLIQLADGLANKDGFVTFEQRIGEYAARHGMEVPPEVKEPWRELKRYFDAKVGGDVYALLGIGAG